MPQHCEHSLLAKYISRMLKEGRQLLEPMECFRFELFCTLLFKTTRLSVISVFCIGWVYHRFNFCDKRADFMPDGQIRWRSILSFMGFGTLYYRSLRSHFFLVSTMGALAFMGGMTSGPWVLVPRQNRKAGVGINCDQC